MSNPRFETELGDGMGARLVYIDTRGARHVLETNLGWDLANSLRTMNTRLIEEATREYSRVFPDPWNEGEAEREATDGQSDSATSARTPTRPDEAIGADGVPRG